MSIITNSEEFLRENPDARAMCEAFDVLHENLVEHVFVPGQLLVKQASQIGCVAVSELTPSGGPLIGEHGGYIMVNDQVMLYLGSCEGGLPAPWAIVIIGDSKYYVQSNYLKPL